MVASWGHSVTVHDGGHSNVAATVTGAAASSVIPLTVRRTDTLTDVLTSLTTNGSGAGTALPVLAVKGAPLATYQGAPTVGGLLATTTA